MRDIPVVYKARIYLILMLFLSSTGCTSFVSWKTHYFRNHENLNVGALNASNSRPEILSRCFQAYNTHAKCDYGFRNSDESVIDIFNDLRPEIDKYAERVDKIKPWIKKKRSRYRPNKKILNEQTFPYKMFLLTISPAVILLVPSEPTYKAYRKNRNCDRLLMTGCIQSQSFRGNAYWFLEQPPVVEGSFWFTPEEPYNTIHKLDVNKDIHNIKINESIVRLSKSNNKWLINRVR